MGFQLSTLPDAFAVLCVHNFTPPPVTSPGAHRECAKRVSWLYKSHIFNNKGHSGSTYLPTELAPGQTLNHSSRWKQGSCFLPASPMFYFHYPFPRSFEIEWKDNDPEEEYYSFGVLEVLQRTIPPLRLRPPLPAEALLSYCRQTLELEAQLRVPQNENTTLCLTNV